MESLDDYRNNKYWNKYFDYVLPKTGGGVLFYTSTNEATGNWVANNTDTTRNTYDSTTHEGVLWLLPTTTTIGGGTSTDYSPFYADTGLTSVDLTYSGLTNINSGSFRSCSNLTSVHIPASVTNIHNTAFYQDLSVASITVDSANTKYNDGNGSNCIIQTSNNTLVFGCKNTVIPNTVVTIGTYAFSKCTGLTTMTIPNNVTTINNNAFQSCSGLTSFTIGSGVTSIGNSTFGACPNLTSVTCLATTPPTLGTGNFPNTNDTLYVPAASVSAYENDSAWRAAFTNIQPIGNYSYITVVAGSNGSVTGSGWYENGTTVTIGATADTHYHFTQWNDGDTNATRTVTVTTNATYTASFAIDTFTITALSNSSSYGSVSGGGTYAYGATVTLTATPSTGYKLLQWNDDDTSNPRTITVTGDATYTALFEEIVYMIEYISSGAVDEHTNSWINQYTYTNKNTWTGAPGQFHYHYWIYPKPNGTTMGGNYGTWYSNGVVSVIDWSNSGITTLESNAVGNTHIASINIPDSVTTIGTGAFTDCFDLESVTIGSGVTTIGDGAFGEIYGGTTLYRLTTVICEATTPPTLGRFNFGASNATLYVPAASVSAYQNDSDWSAVFANITVRSITYTSTRQASGDWVLNNTDTAHNTWDSNTGIGVLYLNSGVTEIGGSASVNSSPFYRDTGLTSVDLQHSGLTTIGISAFRNCYGLTSITIPNTVTIINTNAFQNCYGLTSITFSSSLTFIDESSFGGCDSLTSVTCKATTPPILGTSNFGASNDTLYVPYESLSAYRNDMLWSSKFTTITAIP